MKNIGLARLESHIRRWTDLFSYDASLAGRAGGVAAGGLAVIGLWGLYGDLIFSNLLVVGISILLISAVLLSTVFLVEKMVRSHDRWQVEGALTYRQLLTEAKAFAGDAQVGSPFYARRFETQLQDELARCRTFGTPLTVVAFRLELPGKAPTHAVFSQANVEVAELLGPNQDRFGCPTALGMFEYAFYLPNCDRRTAGQVNEFLASRLGRYRCSFGLATFPQEGENARALLRRAVDGCGVLNSNVA